MSALVPMDDLTLTDEDRAAIRELTGTRYGLLRADWELIARHFKAAGVKRERETCAKVCEATATGSHPDLRPLGAAKAMALECAAAIRARGQREEG